MTDFLNYIVNPLLHTLSISTYAITSIPLLRRWAFGTNNPPPIAHVGSLLALIRSHGIWGRHFVDQALAKQLGHIYCMLPPPGMGGGNVTLVVNISDPVLVQKVLEDTVTFPTRGKTGLGDTVGLGLVELPTGERHSFHRAIIGSMLTHTHLIEYSKTVQEETLVLISKWMRSASDKPSTSIVVNAHYDLTMCTEEIIGIIGLGQHFGAQDILEENNNEVAETAFMMRRAALSTAVGKTALAYLSPSNDTEREEKKRQRAYKETVGRVQVALDSPGGNMIKSMNEAKDDNGASFTAQEIIDEFITIRGAGHETTSNTLSWAIMLLAENAAIQQILFKEIRSVLGYQKLTPTFGDTKQLVLTKCCIYEALRLFPTVPSFPRLSVSETNLGGYDLPSGTLVFVSQSAMNRRKDIWGEDANDFNPLRFQRDGYSLELIQSLPKGVPDGPLYGFAPFGAGKRTCPGQRLALVEMVIMLAGIIQHFEIFLDKPTSEIEKRTDITLGPKLGLPIRLVKRNGGRNAMNMNTCSSKL